MADLSDTTTDSSTVTSSQTVTINAATPLNVSASDGTTLSDTASDKFLYLSINLMESSGVSELFLPFANVVSAGPIIGTHQFIRSNLTKPCNIHRNCTGHRRRM
jgi:hypothetical protein